jgi:hypothetical protein
MRTAAIPGARLADTPMLLGGIVPGLSLALTSCASMTIAASMWVPRGLRGEHFCEKEVLALAAASLVFFCVPTVFVGVGFRLWQRARERARGERVAEDALAARTVGAFTACALFCGLEIVPLFGLRYVWILGIAAALGASALFVLAFRELYRRYRPFDAYALYTAVVGGHCTVIACVFLFLPWQ